MTPSFRVIGLWSRDIGRDAFYLGWWNIVVVAVVVVLVVVVVVVPDE